MESTKFDSADLNHEISFGYKPSQLLLLLKDLNLRYRRAVDIGAGTGRHSIAIAEFCTRSTVFAIEPDVRMWEHALRNLRSSQVKNLLVKKESLEAFSERYVHSFDLVHSCMVSYFTNDSLSDFAKKMAKLASRGSILIFTDFVLKSGSDRKALDLQKNAIRQIFPALSTQEFKCKDELEAIFNTEGWRLETDFIVQKMYPAEEDFSKHLPIIELNRRRQIMNELKAKFFLSEIPKLNLTRTFIFRQIEETK